MMGRAYAYAEGSGPMPKELYISNCIERFGVQATIGRPTLGAKEIRLMAIAENVVEAYKDRAREDDDAAWSQKNPDRSEMLLIAMEQAIKFKYIKAKYA